MSINRHRSLSPQNYRLSRQGFQPLSGSGSDGDMPPANDATIDIPLQTVVSHTSTGKRQDATSPIYKSSTEKSYADKDAQPAKSGGMFRGRRKMAEPNSKGVKLGTGEDGEEDVLNRMGMIYTKIKNFSVITRYFLYVAPVALVLAVPLIVFAVIDRNRYVSNGVQMSWFHLFLWIEVVWLTLWGSKLVAHFLPKVFQTLMGVVSSGTRKYALIIKNLEIPLSLIGWAVASLVSFTAFSRENSNVPGIAAGFQPRWKSVMTSVLGATVACTVVLFAEKFLIQLISINYHRKQFNQKIIDSKRNVHLLGLLLDASRALFPMYCPEFQEEDYIINDTLNLSFGSRKNSNGRPTSANPVRLLQNVNRFGDKITSVFGNVAHEITGKKVFNPNAAHSIVVEALEKNRSSEALARRLWMSFVMEGREALYAEDIADVLGPDSKTEAEECFAALDRDGNGDISLDEMILTVTEFGRERKSVANSMHDVDQAINVLDGLLSVVIFVVCVFIFIGFLNTNFVTTLATAGTAILSLSFVFAATCQEVLGSCIFLFVKHPFDVGDRVDISTEKLVVEHISLLFTNFRRVDNGKVVQVPNIVLNNLWVENISRSKAMRETVSIFVNFDTTFEDIQLLKMEMEKFLRHKDNCRDFQPDIDIDCGSISTMDKMELKMEIRHKSNWANGVLAGARRSKFMCALVLALRKVPIYGPGAGAAALGELGNPSYSVAINPEQAEYNRDEFDKAKDAKRMIPNNASEATKREAAQATGVDYLGSGNEAFAMSQLNQRSVSHDPARDQTLQPVSQLPVSPSLPAGRPSLDTVSEEGSLLRKVSTTGRRRASSQAGHLPTISDTQTTNTGYSSYPTRMASNSGRAPQAGTALGSPNSFNGDEYSSLTGQQMYSQPMSGNAFAQQQQPQQRQGGNGASPYTQPPAGPFQRPYGGT